MLIINRKIRVNGIWEIKRLHIKNKYKLESFHGSFYRFLFVEDGDAKIAEIKLHSGECAIISGGDDVITSKDTKVVIMSLDVSGSSIPEILGRAIHLDAGMVFKLDRVFECLTMNRDLDIENTSSATLHEIANNLEVFFVSILNTTEKLYQANNRGAGIYKEIIDIMRDNVDKALSVDDIAKICGMSSSNLKKIFAKYSSCSIHKYFLKMKIYKAIELLSNNYNISEISEKLSFNNQNYFGIVFKKETGYSPLNYKKLFLHKN